MNRYKHLYEQQQKISKVLEDKLSESESKNRALQAFCWLARFQKLKAERMATSKEYLNFVLEQLSDLEEISCPRKENNKK